MASINSALDFFICILIPASIVISVYFFHRIQNVLLRIVLFIPISIALWWPYLNDYYIRDRQNGSARKIYASHNKIITHIHESIRQYDIDRAYQVSKEYLDEVSSSNGDYFDVNLDSILHKVIVGKPNIASIRKNYRPINVGIPWDAKPAIQLANSELKFPGFELWYSEGNRMQLIINNRGPHTLVMSNPITLNVGKINGEQRPIMAMSIGSCEEKEIKIFPNTIVTLGVNEYVWRDINDQKIYPFNQYVRFTADQVSIKYFIDNVGGKLMEIKCNLVGPISLPIESTNSN